jgi:hypothetical protein
MIALLDNLPIVRLADGTTAPFERRWLLRALDVAARKAGYQKWWLAEHVAESVTEFLRSQNDAPVIPVDGLTRSVQQVLQVIGYAEVGRHFDAGRPVVRISLVEIAHAAGSGYELAFFNLLARRLDEALREAGGCFELVGLEPCVKLLCSKKLWSSDCRTLQDEIVSFTREHAGTTATQNAVQFSVA